MIGRIRLSAAVLCVASVSGLGGCGAGEAGSSPEGRTGLQVAGARSAETARSVGDLTPFETRKAETLLRDRLSCLGCHTLDGEGGRVGPDLSRVGDRLSAEGIRRMITDPRNARPGVIMPRELMPERWVDLLARYLAGQTSGEPRTVDRGLLERPPAPSLPAGDSVLGARAEGAALYGKYCAVCHGARGNGEGPNAPFLPVRPTAHADAGYMSARSDDALFDAIYAGGRIMDRSHRMPPFGEVLSRDQVWTLVAYLRTLCECRGPEWSRDQREGS